MFKSILKIFLVGFISLILLIIVLKVTLTILSENTSTWKTYANTKYGFSIKHPIFLGNDYVGLPAGFSEGMTCNNENHPPVLKGLGYENYEFIFGSTNCESYHPGKAFSLYVLDIDKELNEDTQMVIEEQQLGDIDIESQIKNNTDPYLKYIKLSSNKYLIAVQGSISNQEFKKMTSTIKIE